VVENASSGAIAPHNRAIRPEPRHKVKNVYLERSASAERRIQADVERLVQEIQRAKAGQHPN
jgi:hypothetical protein